MTDIPNSPFAPDYGFPDSLRRSICAFAEETSVAVAAESFGVSTTAIYNWRSAYREAALTQPTETPK